MKTIENKLQENKELKSFAHSPKKVCSRYAFITEQTDKKGGSRLQVLYDVVV